MLLIVGLGNIGIQYRNTYHNMGFLTVDKLSEMLRIDFKHRICKAKVAMTKDGEVILAKPETYMNLSGESVRALMGKYHLTAADIIVIYDDVDIPKGKIRIRESGSGGTHNGMRNILSEIHDENFIRVRMGIGRTDEGELKDYVLSKINREDRELLLSAIEKAAKAVYQYISDRNKDELKRISN